MKLLSLIIALVIWFLIYNTTTSRQIYYINLDLKSNLPSNYEIIYSNAKNVEVTIQGKREALQEITESSFQARVEYISDPDKPNLEEGTKAYKVIIESKIKLPEDVITYTYKPQEVQISLTDKLEDKIIREEIRIEPVLDIELRDGYTVKPIRTEPEKVIIEAKKRIIKGMKVQTEPLKINDLFNTNVYEVGIVLNKPNAEAKILEPADQKVKITIEVEEEKKPKDFPNIKVKYINLDESLAIENKDDLLIGMFTITGPSSIIKDIEEKDIRAYIDLKGMYNTGKFPRNINIEFSEEIKQKLRELRYFYSPQTIYVELIKSYEEDIQVLGRSLFSENAVKDTYNSPFYDRADSATDSNKND